jgi:hypothetical protein
MPLKGVLVLVERDGCLRSLVVLKSGEGLVGEAGGVAGLCLGKACAFAVEDELGVVDEGHAVGLGEGFGAGADEVDVRALLENDARGVDRIANTLDAGDATGLHAAAVHEESIELHAAVGSEEATASGVEGGVVFKDGDGCLDGIDGCAAAGQDFMAGFESAAHAGFVGGGICVGDGPGASVNEERRVVSGGEGHRTMVARRVHSS